MSPVHRYPPRMVAMGALDITSLIALIVIMAIPVSMLVGGIVYVVRLARKGPRATLSAAARRREMA